MNQINALNTKVDENWEKTLSEETKKLYNLAVDSTPDQVFATIRSLITTAQNTADEKAKCCVGNYVGTGTTTRSLYFPFVPDVVFLMENENLYGGGNHTYSSALIRGALYGYGYKSNFTMDLRWSGNALTWSTKEAGQSMKILNGSWGGSAGGTDYIYVAIGH